MPTEGEVDVSVDFLAPASPGYHVSYWMMASPAGQKFGQLLWVLIQVTISSNQKLLLLCNVDSLIV